MFMFALKCVTIYILSITLVFNKHRFVTARTHNECYIKEANKLIQINSTTVNLVYT